MELETIARTLKLARQRVGLSEEGAADAADVSVATIRNSENTYRASKGRTLDVRTLLRLLEAYGLTLATFEELALKNETQERLESLEERVTRVERALDQAGPDTRSQKD